MKILLIAMFAVLSGCASYVSTSTTTYHGERHTERGSLIILPINEKQKDSLQFNAVSDYLQNKLSQQGFTKANSLQQARYVAFITFGIDDGKTTTSTIPIYGQTGGGTSYTTGTVNTGGTFGSFNSTTTTMPTYGVVGARPVSSTSYQRDVFINILKNTDPPQKTYELRAISTGRCGNINSVIRPIIDAMFQNFPGNSGESKRIRTDGQGDC